MTTAAIPSQSTTMSAKAEDNEEGLGAGPIVAIVFVIVGLVVGLLLFYKRKRNMTERLPLNNIPSMSSLQSR